MSQRDEWIEEIGRGIGGICPAEDMKVGLDRLGLDLAPRVSASGREKIDDAASHLRTALAQALPTDDHIIIGHIQAARNILDSLSANYWCCKADFGEHEPSCENYVPESMCACCGAKPISRSVGNIPDLCEDCANNKEASDGR